MTTPTNLAGSNSTFLARNVPLREVDASGGALLCERDGATVRFSATPRGEIAVFELTSDPTFLAFERDGATLYEPVLSAEVAPVFSPKFASVAGAETPPQLGREERRRAANLAPAVRTRAYFPAFLETFLPRDALTANDLTLAKLSPLKLGDRIAAFWNRSSGRFEALETARRDVLRFQLTTPLTTGGTATANALYFDSTTNAYSSAGLEIAVADPFGAFSGAVGARGFAQFFADRGVWEIL